MESARVLDLDLIARRGVAYDAGDLIVVNPRVAVPNADIFFLSKDNCRHPFHRTWIGAAVTRSGSNVSNAEIGKDLDIAVFLRNTIYYRGNLCQGR